jgi:indole-3-glycerol phosphate synthase
VDVNKGVDYEELMANIAKETTKMVGATAQQLLSTVLMSEDVQNVFETAGDEGVELTEEHIMNALELPVAVLMLNNRPLYLFDADSDTAKTIVAAADHRRTTTNTAATTTTTNARTSVAATNNH